MAFRRSKHRGTDTAVPASPEPADAGLAAELAAVAPRQWWNRWTPVLTAVLLLGGGVMAGVEIQQRWGPATVPGGGATFPGGAAGFQGRSGGGAQETEQGSDQAAEQGSDPAAESGGDTTEGTVKLVNGTTVYIVTADGRTVTVRTSDGTAVRTSADGTLSDLAEGDTVTVEGTAGDDNSVTAATITER
ncbi:MULTISPECIES: single stranded DNA-binding domain-containing protein [Catenuloplanes]|uniref:DUF5666 domain-containing protein n=1 Tax=Catenuloplanes niger TaxID=587534 RepID=A0AAE3ZPJ5_9ACTN|nr:hypothetical protein [Catenuloplanes niger]MDR7323206.1 hypothetical protein [Catenuloplanes niger]